MTRFLIFSFAIWLTSAPVLAQDYPEGTYPEGDAKAGAKTYKKCVACHMIGAGAKNRVGPHLNNIFERGVAALADYRYSKAMLKYAARQPQWSKPALDAYLANPRKIVKGGRMSFIGLRKAKDRQNVIAYMQAAK